MKFVRHTPNSLAWEAWRQRLPTPAKPKPNALTPDLCRRDYMLIDDANTASDEDVLIARIRLHLADNCGGTLIR